MLDPAAQLVLDLHPLVKGPRIIGPLEVQFRQFHQLNPHVYTALVKLSRWCRARGWRRGSINLLFERLRWEYAVQTHGDEYRLNNNYRAFYARLLMHDCPDLAEFFDVRVQEVAFDPSTVSTLRHLALESHP